MTFIKVDATQHRDQDYALDPKVMQQLWKMEDGHFWHHARNQWILEALSEQGCSAPRSVLEVGCGSGAVSRALDLAGYQVTGVDTAEALVRKAHERCPSATLVVGDVAALPEGCRGPFEVVGFFDVLEHLDEPRELLVAALRWASPGALVIATVPALRSLFTVVDELSGHKLRFEGGEVKALFESVGIGQVVEYGIFASTLPIQRLERLKRSPSETTSEPAERTRIMTRALRVPPLPVNAALALLTRAERAFGLRSARGRRGASILAVGRFQ